MSIAKLESAAKLAAEYRALEAAIDHLERALAHDAVIRSIVAEDAAEAERSIHLVFTVDESRAVFQAAHDAVKKRFDAVKEQVEAI